MRTLVRLGESLGTTLVITVVALGCSAPKGEWADAEIDASMADPRRDCPGHLQVRYIHAGGDSTILQQLSVPKEITSIPEFHDCQRLLIGPATTYGPLVGVFASSTLGSEYFVPAGLSLPAGLRDTGVIQANVEDSLPFAEIVDFDLIGYDTLGIETGFNCLYLLRDESADFGIKALMVSVGTEETECGKSYQPSMGGHELLAVPYEVPAGLTWEDLPAVARWDWDPATKVQFIGLRCGFFWCEVGPKTGFGSSAAHVYPFAKAKEKRTFWIKGWYDEQQLAVKVGNALRPLAVVGTVVPDSALDDWTDGTFPTESWVPAARIAIRPPAQRYKDKFGMTATQVPSRMDSLQLCQGSWSECATASGESPTRPANCDAAASDRWWARIINQQKSKRYFCVIRTPHKGVPIAGTARWRWLRNDETVWIRCAEGCCQVNPNEEL